MAGHNHHPGCTCGWCTGGWGSNSHSRSSNSYVRSFIPTYGWDYSYIPFISNYKSFTNPNSRCPVCGERVYFYQSPYGGKVFFDELGPPWPKHPCTTSNKAPVAPLDIDIYYPKTPTWKRYRWNPSICNKSHSNEQLQKLTLICDNETIYCFGLQKDLKMKEGSLLHWRNINNTFIEGSFLSDQNTESKVILIVEVPNADEKYYLRQLLNFTVMEKFLESIGKSSRHNVPCHKIDKEYYLLLLEDPTTSPQLLAYIFFRFFNDNDIANKIITHPKAIESGISDILEYIMKRGIKAFMDNLYSEYRYYDDNVIDILRSITNAPLVNGIHRIISEKEKKMSPESLKMSFDSKGWGKK